jgi:hypothetical protein
MQSNFPEIGPTAEQVPVARKRILEAESFYDNRPLPGIRALERNQSPYILMNLVEGRPSLVLAST